MEQSQSFNQKQREMFARLIEEAKNREYAALGTDDDQIEADAITALAKEHGASELVAKMRKLRKEVEDAEDALGDLGFDCDRESISLRYSAPKAWANAVEAAKRSAQTERQAALKRYDLAVLGVWAAQDAQAAKKIVEEIL